MKPLAPFAEGFEGWPGPVLFPLSKAQTDLSIVFINAGVKNGKELPPADLYLDCRGVANPYHIPAYAGKTGDDPLLQVWVEKHTDVLSYGDLIRQAILRLTTRRGVGNELNKPFVVCTLCAHGIHRSRAMKHILAKRLKMCGYNNVEVK